MSTRRMFLALILALLPSGFADRATAQDASATLGIFEAQSDIGVLLHPSKFVYDFSQQTYTITASGENVWFEKDNFHFVWMKVSGDGFFQADVSFVGKGVNPHRKALLMARSSLDADSPYVDIAAHGNGMTALQFRDEKGGPTREVQAAIWSPKHLRIEKHGDYFTMWLAGDDGAFHVAASSPRIALGDSFYVGLGMCSHEKDLSETAIFSNVKISGTSAADWSNAVLYSTLEEITLNSKDRTAIYPAQGRIEAPNWSRDGSYLLFNRNGKIEKIPADGGAPQIIDTGSATNCNNDHGISPDGKALVVSDQSQGDRKSRVYLLPIAGGAPRLITKDGPSYWHGWSPDGKTLAFVGERNGDFDIYAISTEGGAEKRLTTAKGLDDGPEYSPDGKYIYFNSVRSGHMQIWRMNADGSDQIQITNGELNDWFPHLSPDGTQMVCLSFPKEVEGHPENKDVMLRLMNLKDGAITVLARLFGGQGTINVPSWSPDGTKIAFVSYALIPKQ
ncbi:MAG: SMP-30/gluconolactonase/LRE family protein [Candidatus Acidiferrum sp.]